MSLCTTAQSLPKTGRPAAWLVTTLLLIMLLPALPMTAAAQSFSGMGDLPRAQQAAPIPDTLEPPSPVDWRTGTHGPVPGTLGRDTGIAPFGAHLFKGGFRGTRAAGLSPDYRILPGDQITLRAWGAVEIDRVLPVDAQGNIFIPYVGPVQVQGLPHGQLDGRVRSAVRSVFTDNVEVYTNLQGIQPVALFVTGHVVNPGRYAGSPHDSLLYFLDQAAGIDQDTGSYRRVRLIRDGETIALADLYDFLLTGSIPRPQFKDGDTLVVERRGPVVTVAGDVARPHRFELEPDTLTGQSVLDLAQHTPDASHVLVRGVRAQGPFSAYLSLEEFRRTPLNNGDEILFSADERPDTIVVQVEGSYMGPSRFAVPKDARLRELLDSIAVDPRLTDVTAVSIRRLSVAERQRQSLEDSLRRLETTYLGASSATPEEATIRAREAELIQGFVARARQVQPTGRMVVASEDRIADIRLQDGDIITIPERSDSLLISGEVLIPQAMVYVPGQSLRDYIDRAGGFSQHADRKHILVVRQNGEVRAADQVVLRPGDEILVLPEVPTKNLQLAATLTQILYQIAIATKVVVDL
ncbi:polysaccharide biosynthesis/export family protein [Ectothiorhodospira shaposhnikovii]|uniref:polysaccharide biosynthesis/export family protein n=1 Tax=Ectothiorhodospira shaposhnikovii TaxID=1054 RepID=UPI001EE79478|nr:polysaccharide biosynthesis/export family protein [Ectothiorhodospira shaposhnikovii]MCG5514234.1 polysaccharide biosynthesis/export family protein [Ectothiorhodospira shaposhnikovii]